MVRLYFDSTKFDRSIGRKEWEEIWRWKRITEKKLSKALQQQIDNLVVFGTTHPELCQDLIDKIINRPLFIHDKQKL